jgi:chromosome segregation ATPase
MSENLTRELPPDGVQLILTQLGAMDRRFGSMETRFGEMETRLGEMETRFGEMENRLSTLEERVDRRLGETRPIWEQVLVRLDVIDKRQLVFEEKLNEFSERLTGIEERLTLVEERLTVVEERLTVVEEKTALSEKAISNLALDMRAGFKRIERQIGLLAADFAGLRVDQGDLERRMDRLEDKADARPDPGKIPN